MCGDMMRLRQVESVVQIPGNQAVTRRILLEWVCPDCDYFEEAEKEVKAEG